MSECELVAANRKASVRIQIRDVTFDYEKWTRALTTNQTLEHVTMAVSVPSLGCMPAVLEFFRALGRLPRLQRLQFSGAAYCWRLPLPLLLALLENAPNQLATLHIQDVELRGGSSADVEVLAKYVSSMRNLKHFSIAHCRFQMETSKPVLDPLADAVLTSCTLERVFLSATRVNALGGPVSRNRLRDIFARGRRFSSPLKELRLMKFRFSPSVLSALFGNLIMHHRGLEKLLLSSCQWDLSSLRVMAQLIRNNHNLREVHLLGDCSFLETNEDCHADIASALQTSEIRRFFLEPLHRRVETSRSSTVEEEEGIPVSCQSLHVACLESNYNLEEFRLALPFVPKCQGLLEFYLRLNRAGRRTVCFRQGEEEQDKGDNKEAWVNAIIAVNDDVSGIFYFIGLNPSLCAT